MIKWIFDRLVSIIGLIILTPVMLIIAGLIFIDLGRPILFKQQRPGKGGQEFTLFKFRTMSTGRDPTGTLLPDEERLTRFGNLLRKNSLDELPSLFNVLRGEMSFVGPRPLLIEYLALYTKEQDRRHEMLPGITGWAQINGRNAISWEEKFKFDLFYVDNSSFLFDIKILLLTIKKVAIREGVNTQKDRSMAKFRG
jgi:sugar transferase EpsL